MEDSGLPRRVRAAPPRPFSNYQPSPLPRRRRLLPPPPLLTVPPNPANQPRRPVTSLAYAKDTGALYCGGAKGVREVSGESLSAPLRDNSSSKSLFRRLCFK